MDEVQISADAEDGLLCRFEDGGAAVGPLKYVHLSLGD